MLSTLQFLLSSFYLFIFQNALVVVKGLVERRATVSRATLDHITWCLIALISWVSSAHITGGKQEWYVCWTPSFLDKWVEYPYKCTKEGGGHSFQVFPYLAMKECQCWQYNSNYQISVVDMHHYIVKMGYSYLSEPEWTVHKQIEKWTYLVYTWTIKEAHLTKIGLGVMPSYVLCGSKPTTYSELRSLTLWTCAPSADPKTVFEQPLSCSLLFILPFQV